MKAFVTHQKDLGLVRERQEDQCISYSGPNGAILIVSDGMGGHAGGNLASDAAVTQANQILARWMNTGQIDKVSSDKLKVIGLNEAPPTVQEWIHTEEAETQTPEVNIPKRDEIRQLIEAIFIQAQNAVTELAVQNPQEAGNAGCTLTVAILREGWIHVAHIGDSRAYLLRKGTLEPLTVDHSGAMLLVTAGILTPEEARNHPESHRLYRFLGINAPELAIDLYHEPAQANDILMLCSDGLWGMVEDEQMVALLTQHSGLEQASAALIRAANANGGDDNISLSLAQLST